MPWHSASRDPKEASIEGEITAEGARRGRPMAVLSRPTSAIIQTTRSASISGLARIRTTAFVSAFIAGAHSVAGSKVLTTAKHFPGHGDTATDTHLNLATIGGDRQRRAGGMGAIPCRDPEWNRFRDDRVYRSARWMTRISRRRFPRRYQRDSAGRTRIQGNYSHRCPRDGRNSKGFSVGGQRSPSRFLRAPMSCWYPR